MGVPLSLPNVIPCELLVRFRGRDRRRVPLLCGSLPQGTDCVQQAHKLEARVIISLKHNHMHSILNVYARVAYESATFFPVVNPTLVSPNSITTQQHNKHLRDRRFCGLFLLHVRPTPFSYTFNWIIVTSI